MELTILHFYPDLMSLYGSYANVSVLRRTLEAMGNTVRVETVRPGQAAEPAHADFLYMGAGTERAQKAALADFTRFTPALKDAAAAGVPMLFAGNAMELLGRSITDDRGTVYEGIGLADFVSVQGKRRFVEDVYGRTDLYPDAVVGFMNKCSVITGVSAPLLTGLDMGYGNDGEGAPEGYHAGSVFASELTGPILVKNPQLLRVMVSALYAHRGEAAPEIPVDAYMAQGWDITVRQLKARCQKN